MLMIKKLPHLQKINPVHYVVLCIFNSCRYRGVGMSHNVPGFQIRPALLVIPSLSLPTFPVCHYLKAECPPPKKKKS